MLKWPDISFAYLLPEAFQMDAYSRMLISFDDLRTEVACIHKITSI